MARHKLSDRWIHNLHRVVHEKAGISKDPTTKVAATIINGLTREPISDGFNGFSCAIRDTPDRLHDRALKNDLTIHAEVNALMFARGRYANGVLFCTRPPCHICASLITQTRLLDPPGIVAVFATRPPAEFLERWSRSLTLAKEIFEEAGVEQTWLEPL